MRKILILLLLVSGVAKAQWTPQTAWGYQFKRVKVDSSMLLPTDTVRNKAGIAQIGSNLFLYNGYWRVVSGGGGSTDTTSLSNRIDSKVSIADSINGYVTPTTLLDSLGSITVKYQQFTYDEVNHNNVAYIDPILTTKMNIADSGWRYVTPTQLIPYLQTGTDISVKSVTVTGTNGGGHVHLRHQASDPTSTGQSSALFAASDGRLKYKNDGLAVDNIAIIRDTATTLATKTDIAGLATTSSVNSALGLKLNVSDTAAMLSNYVRRSAGTYAQRLALTPTVGQQFYQTNECEGLYVYNGATWERQGNGLLLQEEFIQNPSTSTNLSLPYLTTNASGTGANFSTPSGISNNYSYGLIQMNTGTTTTGLSRIYYNFIGFGNVHYANSITYTEYLVLIPALSDGTNTYRLKVGDESNVVQTTSDNNTQFRYTHSENSGAWSVQYRTNSGIGTNVSTGVTVAANTWYRLGIKRIFPNDMVSGTLTIEFYINGTLTNSVAASPAWYVGVSPFIGIYKTAGTTNAGVVLDYIKHYKLR